MVMQTPFERILGELTRLAQREPLASFARIQEAYNKSLTEGDVQHLATFAANLGGGLGRWDDVLTFLATLLDHGALPEGSPVTRSIHRAMAVMHRCKGDEAAAEESAARGAATGSERCRLDLMTAQMLVRAGRPGEAFPFLERTGAAIGTLAADDEVLDQVVMIGTTIARVCEAQLLGARAVMLAAADAARAAGVRGEDWERRHQAHYQHGRACVLGGLPREALAEVQAMMRLEAAHQATANQRFFSALLACQAQVLRGQHRVAGGALEAVRSHLGGITDEEFRTSAARQLAELEQVISPG